MQNAWGTVLWQVLFSFGKFSLGFQRDVIDMHQNRSYRHLSYPPHTCRTDSVCRDFDVFGSLPLAAAHLSRKSDWMTPYLENARVRESTFLINHQRHNTLRTKIGMDLGQWNVFGGFAQADANSGVFSL